VAVSPVFRSRVACVFTLLILTSFSARVTRAHAQAVRVITGDVDTRQVQALPNHHPLWAGPANDTGAVPADLALSSLTLVLTRSPQQEAAFEEFLAEQRNPASANYHHWLNPAEVGERFGLAEEDIAALSSWLQTEGLHVNWVAPSRVFIGFGGTATDIGRAFQTELHYYDVNGEQRMSVNSDPLIPQALAPAIKAIRGLYTIEEKPLHYDRVLSSISPELGGGASYYLGPLDFNTIYNVQRV
jgi:subtilase family serine protease